MNSLWTQEDIEAIFIQLSKQKMPFADVAFTGMGEGLVMLGSGGFAYVYEAESIKKPQKKYAIKVIGFGDSRVDRRMFLKNVEVQKSLADHHAVKILKYVELMVWVEGNHEIVRVEKADPYEKFVPEYQEENVLYLRFIMMEKLAPIIDEKNLGEIPAVQKILRGEENEILRMAYDIGDALCSIHQNGMIHRDITPKNIFYSEQKDCYLLGDFGIAAMLNDGVADTKVGTRFFRAPEVEREKYDETADIYGFGKMLLYFRNRRERYTEAHTYQKAEKTNTLESIIHKMTDPDPDERYQSMEEVLNELEKFRYGPYLKYQREHRAETMAMCTFFAMLGAVLWKLSFATEMIWRFSIAAGMFWGICILRSMTAFKKKQRSGIEDVAMCVLGLYLLISTGFSVWKLLALFILFGTEIFAGVLGGCALVVQIITIMPQEFSIGMTNVDSFRWMTILCMLFSIKLYFLQSEQNTREKYIRKNNLKNNIHWIYSISIYLTLIITGFMISLWINLYDPSNPVYKWIGMDRLQWLQSYQLVRVGVGGVVLCLIWMLREYVLIKKDMRKQKNEME